MDESKWIGKCHDPNLDKVKVKASTIHARLLPTSPVTNWPPLFMGPGQTTDLLKNSWEKK